MRVVRLGPLIFFSTDTGDAWMLDPADHLALCLARAGDEQPYQILETRSKFNIVWNSEYKLADDLFLFADECDQIRAIAGYPTDLLVQASREMQ